jgi:carbon monoxide dehydrogenase subunit G
MRFENRFDVSAPIERVWDAVLDVERVAPKVPGAQVLERTGDDAYKVAIKVKVGPMSMTYRGDVEITERDAAAHRAVMHARAKESRGQGTANADVTMELTGEDGRTSATITTDVALTGKVASMGRGVLQDVSGRLVQTFAQNLATMLERGEAPEEPVPAQPHRPRPPLRPPPLRPGASPSRRPRATRSTSARWAGRWSPTASATRARWRACSRGSPSSPSGSAGGRRGEPAARPRRRHPGRGDAAGAGPGVRRAGRRPHPRGVRTPAPLASGRREVSAGRAGRPGPILAMLGGRVERGGGQ